MRSPKSAHDFVDVSSKLHLMLNDSNEAVSANRNINLYPNGRFRVSPERFHTQMLLEEFEQQLNHPTFFIKVNNLLCRLNKKLLV